MTTPAIQNLQTLLTKMTQCAICNKHVDDVKINQSMSTLTTEMSFFCHDNCEVRIIDSSFLFSAKSLEDSIHTLMKMVPSEVFNPTHQPNTCDCTTCSKMKFKPGLGIINDSISDYYKDEVISSKLAKLQIANQQMKFSPNFLSFEKLAITKPLPEPPQKKRTRFQLLLEESLT